jgi:hypothetical protein
MHSNPQIALVVTFSVGDYSLSPLLSQLSPVVLTFRFTRTFSHFGVYFLPMCLSANHRRQSHPFPSNFLRPVQTGTSFHPRIDSFFGCLVTQNSIARRQTLRHYSLFRSKPKPFCITLTLGFELFVSTYRLIHTQPNVQ